MRARRREGEICEVLCTKECGKEEEKGEREGRGVHWTRKRGEKERQERERKERAGRCLKPSLSPPTTNIMSLSSSRGPKLNIS